MASPLVLLTGITGFVGSHVAEVLLQSGYRVRGAVRPSKLKPLQEAIKNPDVELVAIEDSATSDFSDALKGVYGVIHVASPLPGKCSAETIIRDTIQGALNVVKQAEQAGVGKIVLTSSFGSVMEASLHTAFAGRTFTESDWSPTTKDDVLAHSQDPFFTYFGLKAIAEKAVWDYAREHPKLDVAAILPGFIYGPYASSFPPPSKDSLGTNGFIGALLSGGSPPGAPPFFIDVRDVAKAHVLALKVAPKAPADIEQKRYLVNAANFPWKAAAAHIRGARPDLTGVTDPEKIADVPGPVSILDSSRALRELGMGEFIKPEQTLEDAVEAIVKLQSN